MKDSTLLIIAAAIVGALLVFRSSSYGTTGATNLGAANAGGVPSLVTGFAQGLNAFATGIEGAISGSGAVMQLDSPGAAEIAQVTAPSLAPVTAGQAAGTSPLSSSQLSFSSNPIPSASQQALQSGTLPGNSAPVLSGGVVGAPPSLAFLNSDNPSVATGIFATSSNFGGATSVDEDELFPNVGSSVDILGITQDNSYAALS